MCLKPKRPKKSGIPSLNKPNIHLHFFFSYTIYNWHGENANDNYFKATGGEKGEFRYLLWLLSAKYM